MNLKDLKQYKSICAEIEELNVELSGNVIRDAVSGSDNEFPYILHTVSVEGLGYSEKNGKLLNKLRHLEEQKESIEKFVDDIPDSLTRRIFEMRFIKGFAWAKTAYMTNSTPDSVRMRCRRYIYRHNDGVFK